MRRAFAPLANRNFRLFFVGQFVSITGTNAQLIAQVWLAVELGASATGIGVLTMLQFAPMLVLLPWGGLLADRLDRRKLFAGVQAGGLAVALVLGLLSATGTATLPALYGLAVVIGVLTAIEFPLRHAMVGDYAESDALAGAVSLVTSQVNASRLLGPALGGLIIATAGLTACFFANVVTYVVVLVALALIRPAEGRPRAVVARERGQFAQGLRYVRSRRELTSALTFLGLFFMLAWCWEVVVPLLVTDAYGGGATTLSILMSGNGLGAMVGALALANRSELDDRTLLGGALAYVAILALLAVAPTPVAAFPLVVLAGACGVIVSIACSVRLQLASAPDMRGRVLALWALAVQGTRPIGSLLSGVLGDRVGARWTVALQGAAVLCVVVPTWLVVAGGKAGALPYLRGLSATRRGRSPAPGTNPSGR